MITLRILTRKSKIGVGNYANDTVQKLLDNKMYPTLRKLYYTYEAISFQDDILDEIHADIRIDKPGIKPEAAKIMDEKLASRRIAALFHTGHDKKAMGIINHNRAKIRHKERNEQIKLRNRERLSKGQLQAANHGHITINVEEK